MHTTRHHGECFLFYSKQRRATRKEVRELEELVESELKDARTTLNIQVQRSTLSHNEVELTTDTK